MQIFNFRPGIKQHCVIMDNFWACISQNGVFFSFTVRNFPYIHYDVLFYAVREVVKVVTGKISSKWGRKKKKRQNGRTFKCNELKCR